MINYKLAKELNDAGFPENVDCNHHPAQKCSCYENWRPTLSELIEACGKTYEEDKDFVLWFSQEGYDEDDDMNWHAGYYGYGNYVYIDDYPSPNEEGKTPEEAVARLWLELNK